MDYDKRMPWRVPGYDLRPLLTASQAVERLPSRASGAARVAGRRPLRRGDALLRALGFGAVASIQGGDGAVVASASPGDGRH